jgi:hypothetical protein
VADGDVQARDACTAADAERVARMIAGENARQIFHLR